ncbi:hypothetical protein ACJW30_05G112100 [Castanea mollissima]
MNKILMIRFHWAGKGTTAAPKRGIYGPLVSAIFVESDFSPSVDGKDCGWSCSSSAIPHFYDFRHSLVEGGCMRGRISREKGRKYVLA